jgi:hypothetical protein
MAEEKKCAASRVHKPHLWSRTTRRAVTEETAGDTFQCPGSVKAGPRVEKGAVSQQRIEEIRQSARARRGRSMFADPTPEMNRLHAPMCRCGVHRKPAGLSAHVQDDGKCTVHPDRPAEPYVRGVAE